VTGLWNGLRSLGPWLGNQVAALIDRHIPQKIQDILGIASPSKVAYALGREVPRGLAGAMRDGIGEVEDAAGRMASAAVGDLGSAGFDLSTHALMTVIPTTPAPMQAMLTIDRSMTGDWLVDGLRQNVQIRYGGNVQAALGG
jgi:hypothetical protein